MARAEADWYAELERASATDAEVEAAIQAVREDGVAGKK